MSVLFTSNLIDQIIKGRCAEFAELMGMHKAPAGELQVNSFQPGAHAVDVVSRNGKKLFGALTQIHTEGLFSGLFPGKKLVDYRLRVHTAAGITLLDDPYRFSCCLDSTELQLFSEGRHERVWQWLGAHPRVVEDCEGIHFALWAPNLRRVSLLLPHTDWDSRVLVLRQQREHGLWELFVPGLSADTPYRFELMSADLRPQLLCYDPFAQRVDTQLACCSRPALPDTCLQAHGWRDHFWQMLHANQSGQDLPLVIHEFSLDEFLPSSGLHWERLAGLLLPELKTLGFTHLLVRDAHARASKGRQQSHALLAPPPELGTGSELQQFIDQAHELELAVVWDLPLATVLAAHGVRQRDSFDWLAHGGALLSLVSGCIDYWHQQMHIDGFRLRELDALLALPQSGLATAHHDKAFAREWLGQLLVRLRERFPSLLLLADTTAAWPELTLTTGKGGMGCDFRLTAVTATVFDTQLRIDQQLVDFQQGNRLQQLICHSPLVEADEALQQVLLLALWALPGRKLLRLDCNQVLSAATWQPESGDDRQLQLGGGLTAATQDLVRRLNLLYQGSPSLYEQDASHEGINVLHAAPGLYVFERLSRHAAEVVLVVVNASQNDCTALRVRPLHKGHYRILCRAGNAVLADTIDAVQPDAAGWLVLHIPACTAMIGSAEG